MTTPQGRLKDRNWRLRNSTWIVGTLACGMLTWASFLYIGIAAKRRAWLVASAAYALGMAAMLTFISTAPKLADGKADTSSWQSSIGAVLMAAVWFGGFVHALIINRSWLRFKAEQVNAPWYEAVDQTLAGATTGPQPGQDPYGFGVDTRQYYADGAPPTSPSDPSGNAAASSEVDGQPVPSPTPSHVSAGGGSSADTAEALIDVNTASLGEMLGRLGLDADTAEKAIVERHRRGGFGSVEEFVEVTSLPPHVYARLRGVLTVSDAAMDVSDTAGGRRPEPRGSGGRVLDV